MSCDDSDGNCDLLHVHKNENPQYLVEDVEYNHYILLQPVRVSLKHAQFKIIIFKSSFMC